MIPGYRSFSVIANGGFSTVYSAYQDRFDRTVAVKVINSDLRDSTAERRFTRECRATGRLTGHPHIITIFEAGSTRDRHPFIAMQYLPGGSVADRIGKSGPLQVRDTLLIGAKIADAMHVAHGVGIIHRDVKPGNILLTATGEPVLSDFGIASLAGMDGSTGQDAFTPTYTAPEILQGEEPSVATDVYALAATLFTMLAGSPPFGFRPGDSAATVMLRVLTQDVPALPRNDIPESVKNLLRNALARDPERRPPNAGTFAADLRQFHEGLGHSVARRPPRSVDAADDAPEVDAPEVPPAPEDDVGTAAHDPTRPRFPGERVDPDSDTEPSDKAGRSTLRWVLVATGAAVVAIVAVVMSGSTINGPVPPTSFPSASPGTASPIPTLVTPAPITSADIQAARPTSLRADDGGETVTLTWRNGSRSSNLVMQTAGSTGLNQLLPDGSAVAPMSDLDPTQGYCFRVGPVLGIDSGTKQSIVAWSDYTCIRGARPPS